MKIRFFLFLCLMVLGLRAQAETMDSLLEKASQHLEEGKKYTTQAGPLIDNLFTKLNKEQDPESAKLDPNDIEAVRDFIVRKDAEIAKLFLAADKEYSQAEVILVRAIEMDPKNAAPRNMYAACLMAETKPEKAKAAALEANKIYTDRIVANPHDVEAYLGKFAMCILLQDPAAARFTIVMGLVSNPDDPKLNEYKAPLKIQDPPAKPKP